MSILNHLRRQIRYAGDMNNPQLIPLWLALEESCGPCDAQTVWQRHCAQVQLLLDVYADTVLPLVWRQTCLDYLHRPLLCLGKLAANAQQQRQLQGFYQELRVLDQYLQPLEYR